jgi:2-haloacid dehalogenase
LALGLNPKFISFDCYGTLVHFQMDKTMAEVMGDRLPLEIAPAFFTSAEAYRFDEVLGDYKPYRQVIRDATRRAAHRHGIAYRDNDGDEIYEAIGTWGPHPGVTKALNALAERWPLIILSNAADDQIAHNVEKLAAPFQAVLTAEQARAYKPRMAAFEFMLDRLGCAPDEIVHVSSSPRYDLITARELGFPRLVLLQRGYEPPQPWIGYHEIHNLAELPSLLAG